MKAELNMKVGKKILFCMKYTDKDTSSDTKSN